MSATQTLANTNRHGTDGFFESIKAADRDRILIRLLQEHGIDGVPGTSKEADVQEVSEGINDTGANGFHPQVHHRIREEVHQAIANPDTTSFFTLRVIIDDEHIRSIIEAANYTLRVGFEIEGPDKHTTLSPITPTQPEAVNKNERLVKWSNSYSMNASTAALPASHEKGKELPEPSPDVLLNKVPLPIKFGQVFDLPATGEPSIRPVPTAKEPAPLVDGFLFHNHVPAAAVLYTEVNNERKVLYWDKVWVPGTGTLRPVGDTASIYVWFEAAPVPGEHDTEPVPVHTKDVSERFPVHFEHDKKEKTVHYTAAGRWEDDKTSDDKTHDANTHDANTHDANTHDANTHDANTHDANTHEVRNGAPSE